MHAGVAVKLLDAKAHDISSSIRVLTYSRSARMEVLESIELRPNQMHCTWQRSSTGLREKHGLVHHPMNHVAQKWIPKSQFSR